MFVHLPSHQERFIRLLSKSERKVLVHAFAYLAHLDSKLHQVEIDPIYTLSHELGLDPQIIVEDVKMIALEDLMTPVDHEQAKRIIIQELINLAYVDGEYSSEERTGVKKIAEIFGIEPDLLIQIEDWVARGRVWIQEGLDLILDKP